MLRSAIYKAKSLIQNNTALYSAVYNTFTFNLDYFKQQIGRKHYPSKFGGMWTDRDDYTEILKAKIARGTVTQDHVALLDQWRQNGSVLLESAIPHAEIDAYLTEVEELKRRQPSPLLIAHAEHEQPAHYSQQAALQYPNMRVLDDFFFSEHSRMILFNKQVVDFMSIVLERPPVLTQSLRLDVGTEQDIHQDTMFVRMNAPMKLAAIWVALEDIKEGTGELMYYPGSHLWEGYLFSGKFKHYDEARDGPEQLEAWNQWMRQEAQRREVKPVTFLANKGDVFIWHAALAHGGSKVTHPGSSRLSLVGHYCPQGVRPLYHYYKPHQRKMYQYLEHQFTTSYYR